MNATSVPLTAKDLPTRLLRCLLHLGRRLRRSKEEGGLPSTALQVLGILHRAGSATATELAAELGVKKQSLTLLLAMLRGREYVARARSDRDARNVALSLTPEGREVFLRELSGRGRRLAGLVEAKLTEEEALALAAVLPILEKLALDGDCAMRPQAERGNGKQ